MDIAICTMFRDSERWHGHNIHQVGKFFEFFEQNSGGHQLTYYVAEGGSTDNTREVLGRWRILLDPGRLYIRTSPPPPNVEVASVVSETRFKHLSACGNIPLREARDDDFTHILWMESDLVPPSDLIPALFEHAETPEWADTLAVAPVPIFQQDGRDRFYDTWAFRDLLGRPWGNDDLAWFRNNPLGFVPVSSVGSCVLLNGTLLREHGIDFQEGCFPALCAAGRKAGLNIYVDTTIEVQHPCSQLVNGRLI